MPKFTGLFSKFFTLIRTAMWRITGTVMFNSVTTGIGTAVVKLANQFKNAKWNRFIDVVSCFFSAGSMIAGVFDRLDGSFNGNVNLRKVFRL